MRARLSTASATWMAAWGGVPWSAVHWVSVCLLLVQACLQLLAHDKSSGSLCPGLLWHTLAVHRCTDSFGHPGGRLYAWMPALYREACFLVNSLV